MAAIHPTLFFTFFFTSLFPTTHTTTTTTTTSTRPPIYAVTPIGVLQGTQDTSPNGLPYYAFRGIPYAKPPVGERRWKVPEAAAPFQTVYQATEFKAGCPQAARAGVLRAEDCLYLDVYVPHTAHSTALMTNASLAWQRWREGQDSNHTLPTSPPGDAESGMAVMVWIHGGAYHSGESSENEAWKMATEQEVVVVVIQYRLGALGFLSSGSSELPGNYGLWDQRLALKWVKANIRGFGGAAAMMTAAGESAGSSSVSQHTLSPHSAGLFRRAVMLSGTAEATWSFNYRPRDTFDRFSKDAGCGDTTSPVTDRLHCLMSLPADVIYNTSVVTAGMNFVTFVPTLDGDFFPKTPAKLLQDQNYLTSIGFYNYEFLVGVLNNEGVIILPWLASVLPALSTTGRVPYAMVDTVLLNTILTDQLGPRYDPSIQDIVNNQYFYPRDPAQVTVPVSKAFDMYTDLSFIVPAVKVVRQHVTRKSGATSTSSAGSASSTGSSTSSGGSSASSPGKSYLFFFDWIPSMTEGSVLEGMPHALDVSYLWGLTNGSLRLPGPILPREHVVSRMYGNMIGAFVKTGDPNNGIDTNLKGQWLPYDVSNETFLRFSLNSSIDHHLHGPRVSFWVDLIPVLQSRWLNQTANQQQPDNQRPPANQGGGSPRLAYLDLSDEDTNALLISMIVVAGVMCLLSVFLFVTLIRFYRRKGSNPEGLGTIED